jgi:hypothetical protein
MNCDGSDTDGIRGSFMLARSSMARPPRDDHWGTVAQEDQRLLEPVLKLPDGWSYENTAVDPSNTWGLSKGVMFEDDDGTCVAMDISNE